MVAYTKLVNACAVLFGRQLQISPAFLAYLQPEGVKTAYRQRLFETHPDRAQILKRSPDVLHRDVQAVREAYDLLIAAVEAGINPVTSQSAPAAAPSRPATKQKPSPAQPSSCESFFYGGRLPRRPLLFGKFLYYSGHVSYPQLIKALTAQRKERPRLGEIADRWNLLTLADIRNVLQARTLGEKFGDCAIRLGYLNAFEVRTLLHRQCMLQRPLGEHFVDISALSTTDLAQMLHAQTSHNQRYR